MKGVKRLYRQEPILAIATTAGAVDVLIGTVQSSLSLAVFGMALGIGGWIVTARLARRPLPPPPAPLYLPDPSTRAPRVQLKSSHPKHQ